jgi:hypothetical protein
MKKKKVKKKRLEKEGGKSLKCAILSGSPSL